MRSMLFQRAIVLVALSIAMVVIVGITFDMTNYNISSSPVRSDNSSQYLDIVNENVNRLMITMNEKMHDETLEQLVRLIVELGHIERPFIMQLLKETLNNKDVDVQLMLAELQDFRKRNETKGIPKIVLSIKTALKYNDTWQNYSLPVLVARSLGGVGNVMGQYATVFTLSRIFNMTGLMATGLRGNLVRFYDHLSMDPIDVGPTRNLTLNGWVRVFKDHNTAPSTYNALQFAAAGLLGPKRFITTFCPIEVQLFGRFQDELRKEFTFNDYLLDKANTVLGGFASMAVIKRKDGPPTYIGVHVRLQDYVSHAKVRWGVRNIRYKYKPYLRRAMQYYKDRYKNTVFVMASDDPEYVEIFLKEEGERNGFLTHGTQGEDMSLLTRCNHSIITLGTFSFWTGFLKPSGKTVYPDVKGWRARTYHFARKTIEDAEVQNFIPLEF
uniref:L-Fucosyltransferase n=1 Tax=Hirondellea gigas TaxID=1518452 RepID=A0A2P2ICL3_9CRUS